MKCKDLFIDKKQSKYLYISIAFSQDFVYYYTIKKVHSSILFFTFNRVYRGIYLGVLIKINEEKITACATPPPSRHF